MKKAQNNLTYINHYYKITDIHAGGEIQISDIEQSIPNIYENLKRENRFTQRTDTLNTTTQ